MPRQPGVQYFVEHHGDHFFVMTNAGSNELWQHSAMTRSHSEHGEPADPRGSSTATYRMATGDQAEDISFSRWSPGNWEAAESTADRPGDGPSRMRAAEGYSAGSGDRADDISFSRWSPVDWEGGASPPAAGSSSLQSSYDRPRPPAAKYQACAADWPEDISFSRWSPIDWEGDMSSTAAAGDSGSRVPLPPLTRYQATSGDRAEDISFSRWSPTDWEGQEGSMSRAASSPSAESSAVVYDECAADKAEDISFSRWSPTDWVVENVQSSDADAGQEGLGEYRLLRISRSRDDALRCRNLMMLTSVLLPARGFAKFSRV